MCVHKVTGVCCRTVMIHSTQCFYTGPLSHWPLVFEYSNVTGLNSVLLVAPLHTHTDNLSRPQDTQIFIGNAVTYNRNFSSSLSPSFLGKFACLDAVELLVAC